MSTTIEKSKAICGRLGIKPKLKGDDGYYFALEEYPNLFTPDGQIILSETLRKDNSGLWERFIDFRITLKYHDIYDSIYIMDNLIAENKLAEAFYEFMEGEKDEVS